MFIRAMPGMTWEMSLESAVGAAADSASTDMVGGGTGWKIEGVMRVKGAERREIGSLERTNSAVIL